MAVLYFRPVTQCKLVNMILAPPRRLATHIRLAFYAGLATYARLAYHARLASYTRLALHARLATHAKLVTHSRLATYAWCANHAWCVIHAWCATHARLASNIGERVIAGKSLCYCALVQEFMWIIAVYTAVNLVNSENSSKYFVGCTKKFFELT